MSKDAGKQLHSLPHALMDQPHRIYFSFIADTLPEAATMITEICQGDIKAPNKRTRHAVKRQQCWNLQITISSAKMPPGTGLGATNRVRLSSPA